MTLFLVHPDITLAAFNMVSCKQLGADSADAFLLADLSIQCWTPSHLRWVYGVAFPMFFFVAAVPMSAFFILRFYRRKAIKASFESHSIVSLEHRCC